MKLYLKDGSVYDGESFGSDTPSPPAGGGAQRAIAHPPAQSLDGGALVFLRPMEGLHPDAML